jgi:hypothetical protein
MRQMYDLLDDNGIFVLQVAGIRPSWQYEDLIWLISAHSHPVLYCASFETDQVSE